jgi:hypothetical protein
MKARYLKAFLASLPAGAVIGVAFGFSQRIIHQVPFFSWLAWVPGEAMFWAVAGAFVTGTAVCVWRLLH